MGRVSPVLGPFLAFCALAGCSSGHKATAPATTTTVSSTVAAPTTTAPPATTTPSSAAPATTTASTVAPAARPRITSYSISPASPVSCNAPTMVDLKWTAVGAKSVDLSIDGHLFASYRGGAQEHLEYLACDGEPHTYLLTARSGSTVATASKIVNTIPH